MNHKTIPRKATYLSCLLLIVVICGIFYLGIGRSAANLENGSTVTYADEKRYEVIQAVYDYDKNNILEVLVSVKTLDHTVSAANVYIVSKDEITDVYKQNEIRTIVSELLNLDTQNIFIQYSTSLVKGTL